MKKCFKSFVVLPTTQTLNANARLGLFRRTCAGSHPF